MKLELGDCSRAYVCSVEERFWEKFSGGICEFSILIEPWSNWLIKAALSKSWPTYVATFKIGGRNIGIWFIRAEEHLETPDRKQFIALFWRQASGWGSYLLFFGVLATVLSVHLSLQHRGAQPQPTMNSYHIRSSKKSLYNSHHSLVTDLASDQTGPRWESNPGHLYEKWRY